VKELAEYMPLVNDARRLLRERESGNRFVTDDVLKRHLHEMWRAYMATESPVTGLALMGEIDRVESALDDEGQQE
jgi:hypothetical protein